MIPLDLLFERGGLPSYALPQGVETRYRGTLGFPPSRVYANFVSSLDGVVALQGVKNSPGLISQRSDTDHFVMGLLRSCADAVLIGAGTLKATPHALWTPENIYPDAADDYAMIRKDLGVSLQPRLVVLTADGDLDPAHPALAAGALVLTTNGGAATLPGQVSEVSTIRVLGDGEALDMNDVVTAVRDEGYEVVLAEGGPTVIGELLEAGLLDELFLTLAPTLAGRAEGAHRPGFVEGVELLPSVSIPGSILSVRKHDEHLFLRYGLAG